MTVEFNTGEQVWQEYQSIQRVIETHHAAKRKINMAATRALQRLGEAVLYSYYLDPQCYPLKKKFNLKLQFADQLDLSTKEKMLAARIFEWEEAIPAEQVGHDTWYEGRTDGYALQKSLQETLDLPFETIQLIVNMPFEAVNMIWERIQAEVAKEMMRLFERGNAGEKIAEIRKAMQWLDAAIGHKYGVRMNALADLTEEQKAYVDSIDLYSYDTLLDAKVGTWSVRQALNLSTDSWWSKMFGLNEPLWGQANALKNLEKNLTQIN